MAAISADVADPRVVVPLLTTARDANERNLRDLEGYRT